MRISPTALLGPSLPQDHANLATGMPLAQPACGTSLLPIAPQAPGPGGAERPQPFSRSTRWVPTRRALAMAVSEGFTAPIVGMKLVSTT